MDDLISEFSKQFDFLDAVRLLNSVESQDDTRGDQHVVSCMNHLLLKASKSRMDVLKSFKASPLVWEFGASFGLIPFHADYIDYVECDIDIQDISIPQHSYWLKSYIT